MSNPQPPPADETPGQRKRRLRRERNRRWYGKHKEARSVLRKTLSDAPNSRLRSQAIAELSRGGVDLAEVVRLNELERRLLFVQRLASDLAEKNRAIEARLNGPPAPAWEVGDIVVVPVPLLQSVNRKAVSTTLNVLAIGEIVIANQLRKEVTVRVSDDQVVSVRFDQIFPTRRKSAPKSGRGGR